MALASLSVLSTPSVGPNPSSLESLSDDQLHATVRRLTARSNLDLADLLTHLGEVEARGIHRERACASLYTYCVYELRMSEDAAYRRSKAARIVHRHPGLRDAVARGELHLTGLLLIAPHLGGERHAEVLARARFKSKREIVRLLAELDPKPPVPARIVPLAPAAPPTATHQSYSDALAGPVRSLREGDRPSDWMDPEATGDESTESEASGDETTGDATSRSEAPRSEARELDAADDALASARDAGERDASERDAGPAPRALCYEVRFTASQEYVDLIEEALELLGESRKEAALPELQLRALRELVERLRKKKRGASAAPARDDASSSSETVRDDASSSDEMEPSGDGASSPVGRPAPARVAAPSGSRYVPAAVRRAVHGRDAGRCAYVDDGGRRCSETGRLELHHRVPHARGGPMTTENLELRCRAHNALAAEKDFGREHVRWRQGRGDLDAEHELSQN